MKNGSKRALVVLLLGGAVAAGGLAYRQSLWPAPVPPVQTAEPAVAPSAPATEAAAQPEPRALVPADQSAATPEPAPEGPTPPAPRFDLVRVEADGTTLVAGAAGVGDLVLVLLDGAEIGRAETGSDGKFVSFLDLGRSDKPRMLQLQVGDGDAARLSDEDVIVAPSPLVAAASESAAGTPADTSAAPEAPADTPATVTATADAQAPATMAEAPAPAIAPEQTQATTAAAEPVAAPQVAQSPTVLVSRADGVRVLTAPDTDSTGAPQVLQQLALDAITYPSAGAVALTGRGDETAFVRIYLDNRAVLTSPVSQGGAWRADLPDVDTGVYTLRVDQIDRDGTVTARVESPFRREDPAVLAAAQGDGNAPVRAITVQPGNTLWAIARDRYGEGTAFVRVFDANRDRIRDPDLIYPGQVFDLPD